MNKLTAVFLDVLGNESGQIKRVTDFVKHNIQDEFTKRVGNLLSPDTLFFSDEGKELKKQLVTLQSKIMCVERAQQATGIIRLLEELYIRAETLHQETQRQIHRSGLINVRKLHFFYHREQSEALDILEEYIKVELFRIAVYGGGRVFLTRKPRMCFQHTLQDRVRYLKEELFSITDTQIFRDTISKGHWAVQHYEAMKAGPLGVLPGFLDTDPVKTNHRFFPGKYEILPDRKGVIIQGNGYLTNLTPLNVEKAQQKGALVTSIMPDQLIRYVDNLQDPDAVLGNLFMDKYYLINASEYFGVASYVEASFAIIRRSRLGQCLFCGKPVGEAHLCGNCEKRIKIV